MVKEEKIEEDKKKKGKPKIAKNTAKEAKENTAEATKSEATHVKPEASEKTEAKAEAKVEVKNEAKPEPKPKKKRGAAKKPSKKAFVARGKRKESVARATITEGKGEVRVNSCNVKSINNAYVREIIVEPLRYVGPEANSVDISVNVAGGGVMGQAQAARTAIANALVLYFDQMNLKQKFTEIDRSLVVEDTRRVEPKKYRGPKARARFQKSYR